MVTLAHAQRLTLLPALALAIGGGLLIAIATVALPTTLLDRFLTTSEIPTAPEATGSSLGLTTRIVLGLVLGGGFTALAWLGLSLMRRGETVGYSALFNRGDVHPDAPPRPPLFAARDLGTPFLEVKAPVDGATVDDPLDMIPIEQPLPCDLDRPLADFDPGAILAEPLPAAETVSPLATVIEPIPAPRPALFDPGDRIETFELTPARPLSLRVDPVAPAARIQDASPVTTAEPVVAPETEATVHDLLARLERGIARRPIASAPIEKAISPTALPTGSLAGTLGDLRRLATS